jgi:hypothetical protein
MFDWLRNILGSRDERIRPHGLMLVRARFDAAQTTPDNRTAETAEWDVELLPIELGELRGDGVDLKLLGFTDKELAEYLREFDTDLEDGEGDPDGIGTDTIRCPKCGHEFPVE